MKKLFLPLILLFLGVPAIRAQTGLNYMEDILNQYGIPYTVVTAFNTGGGASGTVAVNPNGFRPNVTFDAYSALNIELYTNEEFIHLNNGQTYPASSWSAIASGPYNSLPAVSDQSGAQLFLKNKAGGGLKSAQIKSDGSRLLVFCSDNYSYRFEIAYHSDGNGLIHLDLIAGGGDQ